jgi:hypothetical protein
MRVIGLIILLSLPVVIVAQEYIEASGQTVVFELKAGAKAGWNTTGVFLQRHNGSRAISINRITDNHGRLSFVIAGAPSAKNIILTVFNAMGSTVEKVSMPAGKILPLSAVLANGYYTARIESAGRIMMNTSFVVAR